MRRALLIAFHFPPFSGSSGLLRSLKFVKYLPEFGWEPLLLTVDPRAYPVTSTDLMSEIPEGAVVERAFGLDAGRHLAFRGRYLGLTALPDRWASWWPAGVAIGMRMIRRYRPAVIWATYPIATAHLIGATLARLSGLPLVVDYRDAMVVDDFPVDPTQRKIFKFIERRIIRRARVAVFTTPSSRDLYRVRYPGELPEKMTCIRNGYDEADFPEPAPMLPRSKGAPITLLHSGLLQLNERDPRPFLAALSALINSGEIGRDAVRVVFRAPGDEEGHRRIVAAAGLQHVVRIEPRIGYADALREMAASDALLIFQDVYCNHLVPAKLYEYIRTRRPVLALTDHRGETAELVREADAGMVLDLASTDEIRGGLATFLRSIETGKALGASDASAQRYSRRSQTGELAGILDKVTSGQIAADSAGMPMHHVT